MNAADGSVGSLTLCPTCARTIVVPGAGDGPPPLPQSKPAEPLPEEDDEEWDGELVEEEEETPPRPRDEGAPFHLAGAVCIVGSVVAAAGFCAFNPAFGGVVLVSGLVIGFCILAAVPNVPPCPSCGARTGSAWDHQTVHGGPDRRYSRNRRRCLNCGITLERCDR